MPRVSTDDAASRLTAIYLGPPGVRFPFDVRMQALGVWGVATMLLIWLSFVLSPPGTRLHLFGSLAAPFAAAAIATAVMRFVDADRPIRGVLQMLRDEVDTPRPLPDAETTYKVSLPTNIYVPEGR